MHFVDEERLNMNTLAEDHRSVCILILQFNSSDLTLQLLESMIEHEHKNLSKYRVIVMDNASESPRREAIINNFPFVEYIAYSKNYGFAKAHNLVMDSVKEDWVLLLNNDCILANDAITRTLYLAEKLKADFATCHLLNSDLSDQINFSTVPTPLRRIFLNFSGINKLFLQRYRLNSNISRVGYINGAFLLLKKDRIPTPALFDERYFMYTEDLDLMIRMKMQKRSGFRINSGRVIHLGGASAEREWGDNIRLATKMAQASECFSCYYPAWQVAIWSKLNRFSKRLSRKNF